MHKDTFTKPAQPSSQIGDISWSLSTLCLSQEGSGQTVQVLMPSLLANVISTKTLILAHIKLWSI